MVDTFKRETVTAVLLVIGISSSSLTIIDRLASIIYGFNFQPHRAHMLPGFTLWGHILNGSAATLGLFLIFKLYDYGEKRSR